MKLNFRNVHFDLDNETRDYAAEKIGRLEKYYKNIIAADITFEGRGESKKKTNTACNIKVRVKIPGKDLFAEYGGNDARAVIDALEEKLEHQVKKVKDKENPKRLTKAKELFRNFFGK
jgi:ribosomal subunit interface protein